MHTVPILCQAAIGNCTDQERSTLSLPCPEECVELLGKKLHSPDPEEGRQAHKALLEISGKGRTPNIATNALSFLKLSPFWAPVYA
jgi:hypothetical protein